MSNRLLALIALSSLSSLAAAAEWEVEVTNVTPGQTFTPILVAVHYGDAGVPAVGNAPSEALAMLAEGGATGPLGAEILAAVPAGAHVATIDGLLGPGQTATTRVRGGFGQRLTLAAMLIPTNDTFFSVPGVFLPLHGETTVQALAYDAGSEPNSQSCADIPGPRCGGEGYSALPGEGFVHVSNGFHDLGAAGPGEPEILKPAEYTWNNPVAIVTIRRVFSSR